MTNFIEEQQREVETKYPFSRSQAKLNWNDVNSVVAQTITNTLQHLLESGLLEEKDMEVAIKHNSDAGAGDVIGHNTLARDIKEFISNMDKV